MIKFIIKLTANNPLIAAQIMPIITGIQGIDVVPTSSPTSLSLNTKDPNIATAAIKNENLATPSLLSPVISPPAMVDPDLDTPAILQTPEQVPLQPHLYILRL